jgi:hypothetical protein
MPKKIKNPSFAERYNLDEIDKRIIQLKLKHPNISMRDLAQALDVTVNTIFTHCNKPGFVQAYEEVTATTEDLLKKAAREGALRLIQIIKTGDNDAAVKAIRMALAPYVNQHAVDVSVKPAREFKTTFQPDGTLLQEVIDAELGPIVEALRDGEPRQPVFAEEENPEE